MQAVQAKASRFFKLFDFLGTVESLDIGSYTSRFCKFLFVWRSPVLGLSQYDCLCHCLCSNLSALKTVWSALPWLHSWLRLVVEHYKSRCHNGSGLLVHDIYTTSLNHKDMPTPCWSVVCVCVARDCSVLPPAECWCDHVISFNYCCHHHYAECCSRFFFLFLFNSIDWWRCCMNWLWLLSIWISATPSAISCTESIPLG